VPLLRWNRRDTECYYAGRARNLCRYQSAGEGLVEALSDANAVRRDHDGKERLLIFSDSRQDAAHQARFIIFASRYDRMRRRLFQILLTNPNIGLQRAVELLGEAGVRAGDNPHGPDDPERRLSEDERLRFAAGRKRRYSTKSPSRRSSAARLSTWVFFPSPTTDWTTSAAIAVGYCVNGGELRLSNWRTYAGTSSTSLRVPRHALAQDAALPSAVHRLP